MIEPTIHKPRGKSQYWTKDQWAVYMREYRLKNKARVNAIAKKSRLKNIDEYRKRNKKWCSIVRRETLAYYSQGKLWCSCCHINHFEFLTIDHIYGGGTQHTKEVGAGSALYRWLRRNNFPAGFQVLCYNCNCSKKTKGRCDCPFDYTQSNNKKRPS